MYVNTLYVEQKPKQESHQKAELLNKLLPILGVKYPSPSTNQPTTFQLPPAGDPRTLDAQAEQQKAAASGRLLPCMTCRNGPTAGKAAFHRTASRVRSVPTLAGPAVAGPNSNPGGFGGPQNQGGFGGPQGGFGGNRGGFGGPGPQGGFGGPQGQFGGPQGGRTQFEDTISTSVQLFTE
ncbi:hypothetical protein COOONC_08576 [Cooperia oncophora]